VISFFLLPKLSKNFTSFPEPANIESQPGQLPSVLTGPGGVQAVPSFNRWFQAPPGFHSLVALWLDSPPAPPTMFEKPKTNRQGPVRGTLQRDSPPPLSFSHSGLLSPGKFTRSTSVVTKNPLSTPLCVYLFLFQHDPSLLFFKPVVKVPSNWAAVLF